MRSDRDLCPGQSGQYKGTLTGADLRRLAVQYLRPRRSSARPDRQSWRSFSSGGDGPRKTHYLYFVANTQGGHFFAATLEEHNRNVTKYPASCGPARTAAGEARAAATIAQKYRAPTDSEANTQ